MITIWKKSLINLATSKIYVNNNQKIEYYLINKIFVFIFLFSRYNNNICVIEKYAFKKLKFIDMKDI
jgi:hypothetical protein